MASTIGLFNLEPTVENTALMQVSRFHKDRGDHVEFYQHLFPNRYDKVYAFSLFQETDKAMVRRFMIRGGTGFNVARKLPPEIEALREIGIDPFVMPYNKTDDYQRNLARYVNHKATFKTTAWHEYNGGVLKKWLKVDA